MRYHWGMGIGHTYTWRDASSLDQPMASLNELAADQHFCADSSAALALDLGGQDHHRENRGVDWDNLDDEVMSFESESGSESSAFVGGREESDDETYMEMMRMYG